MVVNVVGFFFGKSVQDNFEEDLILLLQSKDYMMYEEKFLLIFLGRY